MTISSFHLKRYLTSLTLVSIIIGILSFAFFQLGLIGAESIVVALIAAALGHFVGIYPIRDPGPSRSTSNDSRSSKSSDEVSSNSNNSDATTIYVGNLIYRTRREELSKLFEPYGEVLSARIILDRETRKSKGFGFVDMVESQAQVAIAKLDGFEFNGRAIRVKEAKGK